MLRRLGRCDYRPVWHAMQEYTARRGPADPDQLWQVEHPPIYTQGLNGRAEHLRDAGDIPVVRVDRGGQITYHGPGQLILYALIDLGRRGLGVRALVTHLERAVIIYLADCGITGRARADAPGVYVDGRKIASLGLRVRRGCCYHGLSLNVAMDLEPFSRIDPCGLPGLEVTQLVDLGGPDEIEAVERRLVPILAKELGYSGVSDER